MTKILPLLHIQMMINLGVLDSQATAIYLVSTLARCFKDLKTKCTKAAKEVPNEHMEKERQWCHPWVLEYCNKM